MRNRIWAGAGLVVAAAVTLFLTLPRPADSAPAESSPTAKLPIKKVVLFSAGVGYFQRAGSIEGDAKFDLTFPTRDINDLLKSLTLQDLGGGLIQSVSYDSHEPVERTLQSFALNLAGNPSQSQILNQARGERVELKTLTGSVSGQVVGIEKQNRPANNSTIEIEVLNLYTSEGLQSVPLLDIQKIRFGNASLDAELKRALDALTMSRDKQKKSVGLKFTGAGQREVRVSYVVEAPIWKTSYRLVLDKDGKPFLQGWAVVENATDEDWSDVRMSLVSGRPISFRMDLYDSLYMPRPVVEPELFASLRPPTYEGAMERGRGGLAINKAPGTFTSDLDLSKKNPPSFQYAIPPFAYPNNRGFVDVDGAVTSDRNGNIVSAVGPTATAISLGDSFQYSIDQPISLGRQKSALLPIVNKAVDGQRVSIYNAAVLEKHPLMGLRFKNTSGGNLAQGPVTVFEGTSFSGDARMPDLQPDEERLLSYAIDLGVEVERQVKRQSPETTVVKILKGVMISTVKNRESVTYKAINRGTTDRKLLIEHPFRSEFKLVGGAKPAERTRDQYRFEMALAAKQSASQEVSEERDVQTDVTLVDTHENTIMVILKQPALGPKVKQSLEKVLELRNRLSGTQRDLELVNRQIAEITKEQERLRANLKEMPATAAAYKRYLDKFDTQETLIEKLQADQKRLQDSETQQRSQFAEHVNNLTVEA